MVHSVQYGGWDQRMAGDIALGPLHPSWRLLPGARGFLQPGWLSATNTGPNRDHPNERNQRADRPDGHGDAHPRQHRMPASGHGIGFYRIRILIIAASLC